MSRSLVTLLASAALFSIVLPSLAADELPAGTTLEVRLSVATGSRLSHTGDRVEGTIIAPVLSLGRVLISQGTAVLGTVASVERLGLGLKHLTAGIEYCFHTLRLPDGEMVPIETRLIEVQTAKERVNVAGGVGGIHPTANLSSSISLYALPFLSVAPEVVGPVLAIKLLIARSPDPEIYFPPGTEIILQLTAAADIHRPSISPPDVASLPADEIADARRLLDRSPQSRAVKESGQPSDLVNILFLGSREQIDLAFHAAGWSGAQRRSAMSLYRMYHSLVERIGYSMAPMQKLTLSGKPPDAAYEKSLDTFSKRHHLRLWKEPGSDFWLCTATEDVGYTFHGLNLTHATDPRIDNERAKVVNDLNFTGCLDAATLLRRDSLRTADNTLGSVLTDGSIAVVRLNSCRSPRTIPTVVANFGRRPHRRFVRGLVALRSDITRSNLIFLVYNTIKLLNAKQGDSKQPQLDLPNAIQATWVRGSVLSASLSSPPAPELASR
jgi:hypothetical protein